MSSHWYCPFLTQTPTFISRLAYTSITPEGRVLGRAMDVSAKHEITGRFWLSIALQSEGGFWAMLCRWTHLLEAEVTNCLHPTEESIDSPWGFLSGSNGTEDCAHSRSWKTFSIVIDAKQRLRSLFHGITSKDVKSKIAPSQCFCGGLKMS